MKARQYSAYSPAYSPAMSGHTSKAHLHSSSGGASGAKSIDHNPVQSPIYVPPSMGSAQDTAKVVQSPQYVAHAGTAANFVQSPAYNPASPQYAPISE